jgi:hypothetical protein
MSRVTNAPQLQHLPFLFHPCHPWHWSRDPIPLILQQSFEMQINLFGWHPLPTAVDTLLAVYWNPQGSMVPATFPLALHLLDTTVGPHQMHWALDTLGLTPAPHAKSMTAHDMASHQSVLLLQQKVSKAFFPFFPLVNRFNSESKSHHPWHGIACSSVHVHTIDFWGLLITEEL